MKANGIICEFDKAGRIIIPKVFRKHVTDENCNKVQIVLTSGGVLLKKPERGCIICGSESGLVTFDDGFLCVNCIVKIKNI